MGELSSSLPDELNFLLRGRAPGKRQVKPVSIEKAQASLAWVKNICGDDDDDADEDEFPGENPEGQSKEGEGLEASSRDNDDSGEEDPEEESDEEMAEDEEVEEDVASPGASGEEIAEEVKPSKLVVKRAVQIAEADTEKETTAVPASLGFLLKTRAPGKRKVKPVSAEKAAVLTEIGGSDEDDQDFQIGEEHDDEDISDEDSEADSESSDSDRSYSPGVKKNKKKKTSAERSASSDSDVEITKEERIPIHIDLDALENESSVSSKALLESVTNASKVETLVCFVCLKDSNDDRDNELVQCDGCGIACHVLCYGIGECSDDGEGNVDGRSTPLSTASTEPWFCDVCRAGTGKPTCQLCPNEGGAFKQTDSGHWVHLICALYTGCSFGEVGGLTRVNVNSIKQKLWGTRVCMLCSDPQYASTGVCVSCDAGMCRIVFHVTCAQREGLLADAPVAVAASVLSSSMQSPMAKLPRVHRDDYSSDEERKKNRKLASQEAADPFYACCKRHSNPEITKRNKRNCLAAFRICNTFKQEDRWELAIGRDRYERKLCGARERFLSRTQKMVRSFEASSALSLCYQSRPITSCPEFVKRAALKAKLGGVDEEQFVSSPTFNNSAAVSSSHYSPLSFTARFIQYFEARNRRIDELRAQCSTNDSQQGDAAREESELKKTYEVLFQSVRRHRDQGDRHCAEVAEIHSCVADLLNKYFNSQQDNSDFVFTVPALPKELAVTTDRKQFENELKETAGITIFECYVCKQTRDQHMMMECGTCKKHFHCFCLDPPLSQPWTPANKTTRRSSAKWSWECHFCCPSSSDGDVILKPEMNLDAPRQLRREIKAPVRFIVSSEEADHSSKQTKEKEKEKDAGPSTSKEEKTNGRNVCHTHKSAGRGGRKRSRGAAEVKAASNESPAKKQGKQQQSPIKVATPPLKLVIPSISAAVLVKSPVKPPDPGVYDFSSDSNE